MTDNYQHEIGIYSKYAETDQSLAVTKFEV